MDPTDEFSLPDTYTEKLHKIATRWHSRVDKIWQDQLDAFPLMVEHKLQHWPDTAHTFISGLTNKNPVFIMQDSDWPV